MNEVMENHQQANGEEHLMQLAADEGFHVEIDVSAEQELGKIIKVLAIGGAGGNAGNFVYKKHLPFVEVAAYNTDQQDLNTLAIEKKYLIGEKVTAMMGAGRDPKLGEEAMRESVDLLYAFLQDDRENGSNRSRFAFVLGGLGGGTASGAVPVAAEVCREMGYITIAVLTIPPRHHGDEAMQIALEALEKVEKQVDKVLLIDNEKIYSRLSHEKKLAAFRVVDAKIADAIESFVHIISRVPRENVDPNDIRTVLKSSDTKLAVIGTGEACRDASAGSQVGGEDTSRVLAAVDNAINSPILLYNSILTATTFLVHTVTHPDDALAAFEDRVIAKRLKERSRQRGQAPSQKFSILGGGGVDPSMQKGAVQVTLIATGFETDPPSTIVKRILQIEAEDSAGEPMLGVEECTEDERLIMKLLGQEPSLASPSDAAQTVSSIPEQRENPVITLPSEIISEQSEGTGRRRRAAKTQAEVQRRDMGHPRPNLFEDVESKPLRPDGETMLQRIRRQGQQEQQGTHD